MMLAGPLTLPLIISEAAEYSDELIFLLGNLSIPLFLAAYRGVFWQKRSRALFGGRAHRGDGGRNRSREV